MRTNSLKEMYLSARANIGEELNDIQQKNVYNIPKMMTVRQVAATGLLPESAIRRLLREKKIVAVYSGKKAFINFDLLCNQLANLTLSV